MLVGEYWEKKPGADLNEEISRCKEGGFVETISYSEDRILLVNPKSLSSYDNYWDNINLVMFKKYYKKIADPKFMDVKCFDFNGMPVTFTLDSRRLSGIIPATLREVTS